MLFYLIESLFVGIFVYLWILFTSAPFVKTDPFEEIGVDYWQLSLQKKQGLILLQRYGRNDLAEEIANLTRSLGEGKADESQSV